jgi:uncharacterized protein YcfL
MNKNTLLIAAASLALAGCSQMRTTTHDTTQTIVTGHMGGAYKPVNTEKYDLENHLPIVLMDRQVQRSITVPEESLIKAVTPDGRLKVQVSFRNRLQRPIQVQVSCIFKGPEGFSTGDETPWQTLSMTENSQETMTFIAMNTSATQFTIRVREVR